MVAMTATAERAYVPSILALLGEQDLLADVLPPELAVVARDVAKLLDAEIGEPLRKCETRAELEQAAEAVLPRLTELSVALGLLVMRAVAGSPEELVRRLWGRVPRAIDPDRLAARIGDKAAGDVLAGVHAIARAVARSLAGEPSPDAARALFRFVAALIALGRDDRPPRPGLLAGYAREQALAFSYGAKTTAARLPARERAARADSDDAALALAAFRAWLEREHRESGPG